VESRQVFLFWVLRACVLPPVQYAYLEGLALSEGQPPHGVDPRKMSPTMIFQSPVEERADLGLASQDGYAREVLDEDKTYVSVKGFGWIPLSEV
jgi:hypothetical protein